MSNGAATDPRKFSKCFGGGSTWNQVNNTGILVCKKQISQHKGAATLMRHCTSIDILVADSAVRAGKTAPTQENL
jgi:hypothetical protein